MQEFSRSDRYTKLDRKGREDRADAIIKYFKLDKKPYKNILDLGCGAGELSKKLLDIGHTVTSTNCKPYMTTRSTSENMLKELKHYGIDVKEYQFAPVANWLVRSQSYKQLMKLRSTQHDLILHLLSNIHYEGPEVSAEAEKPLKLMPESNWGLFIQDMKQLLTDTGQLWVSFRPMYETHDGYGSDFLKQYRVNNFPETLGDCLVKIINNE